MDKIAIDLGFIQIYWYSIFIFLGIIVASFVALKESKKVGLDENFLVNLIFNVIIVGIIGARAYYVLFNLSYYITNPLEILAIWNGGLAIHGGILAGLIFVIFYCKRHKVNLLQMTDIIVVSLIIAQAIGRWGNFFNSEAYGNITTLENLQKQGIPAFIINGMYILGEYRQPTFFYESMWCLTGFIAMLLIRRCKTLKIGQLTGFYLIWYGIVRFFIEGLRSDSLMLGTIKVAQIISLVFILSGIILFIYNIKKATPEEPRLYGVSLENKNKKLNIYFK